MVTPGRVGRFAGLSAVLAIAATLVPASALAALKLNEVETYSSPVYVTSDPAKAGRLFVVELGLPRGVPRLRVRCRLRRAELHRPRLQVLLRCRQPAQLLDHRRLRRPRPSPRQPRRPLPVRGLLRRRAALAEARPAERVDDRSEGASVSQPSSFGEDARGRIYVASLSGPVYRLAPQP
jgi:hypothetical protein